MNTGWTGILVMPNAGTACKTDEGLPHCIVAQVRTLFGNEECIRQAVVMKALPLLSIQPPLVGSRGVKSYQSGYTKLSLKDLKVRWICIQVNIAYGKGNGLAASQSGAGDQ